MRVKDLKQVKKDLAEIKNSRKIQNDKIIDALNTMPSIRNKNVRKAYAEIYQTIYGMIA